MLKGEGRIVTNCELITPPIDYMEVFEKCYRLCVTLLLCFNVFPNCIMQFAKVNGYVINRECSSMLFKIVVI